MLYSQFAGAPIFFPLKGKIKNVQSSFGMGRYMVKGKGGGGGGERGGIPTLSSTTRHLSQRRGSPQAKPQQQKIFVFHKFEG